jgi:hypothetical protein
MKAVVLDATTERAIIATNINTTSDRREAFRNPINVKRKKIAKILNKRLCRARRRFISRRSTSTFDASSARTASGVQPQQPLSQAL